MMKWKMVCLLSLCLFVWGCSSLESPGMNTGPGNKAPDFTLPDQNGDPLSLSEVMQDYRGAVIAFYPKDDSRN